MLIPSLINVNSKLIVSFCLDFHVNINDVLDQEELFCYALLHLITPGKFLPLRSSHEAFAETSVRIPMGFT